MKKIAALLVFAVLISGCSDGKEKDSSAGGQAEERIDLTDALDNIRAMQGILNGRAVTDTGTHERWYEDETGKVFGYGNFPGSNSVDEMWIYSGQYSIYDVYVGENTDEAVSVLLDQGWEEEKASGNYTTYVREDLSLGLLEKGGTITCIDILREYKKEEPEPEPEPVPTPEPEPEPEPTPQYTYRTGRIYISPTAANQRLRVRTGPGTSYTIYEKRLYPGDRVTVYESVYSGGYTWHRIGNKRWIADDGRSFYVIFDY